MVSLPISGLSVSVDGVRKAYPGNLSINPTLVLFCFLTEYGIEIHFMGGTKLEITTSQPDRRAQLVKLLEISSAAASQV